ncbi:hypothetical protein SAMN02982927_00342 [Sporolactobacillus nakayamae]|uniref:Uncharacterized protein n=1 Tax=Sporolactobacillus nakayamae TaxID=269670 RepID=A0A1I2N7A7_9BACL|nr:hypothetical protein SAMN02982927_00342 [Sporolactobacillus nakayamae]
MEKDKTVYCDGTRHLTRSELQNLVERSETRHNVLNAALQSLLIMLARLFCSFHFLVLFNVDAGKVNPRSVNRIL